MTSENMDMTGTTRPLLFHMLYNDIIAHLGEPLAENPASYGALVDFTSTRELRHHTKTWMSPVSGDICGKTYELSSNPLGITSVRFDFEGDLGIMTFENGEGEGRLEFGIGYNKLGKFPGKRRMSLTASVYEDGAYDCAASGEWTEERKLKITARVIDTYLGKVVFNVGFKDDKISLTSVRHAQRILDGYGFTAAGSIK